MGELVMAGVADFWIVALVVDFRDRRHRRSREHATAGAARADAALTGAPSGHRMVELPSDALRKHQNRASAGDAFIAFLLAFALGVVLASRSLDPNETLHRRLGRTS